MTGGRATQDNMTRSISFRVEPKAAFYPMATTLMTSSKQQVEGIHRTTWEMMYKISSATVTCAAYKATSTQPTLN